MYIIIYFVVRGPSTSNSQLRLTVGLLTLGNKADDLLTSSLLNA